jgi:putative membrane protein
MKLTPQLSRITYALLAVFIATVLARGQSETTSLLIFSSIAMFGVCWTSAIHLLGARPAAHFVAIGVTVGWIAEQLGSSYGWFFGSYNYTAVLGPRLGDVPVIIPLMWFALCYVAYVLSNLIAWQTPSDGDVPLRRAAVMSLLAALLVTAYDLGADPYMVYVLKAWIMTKTDGWWFGETVQGFAGWAFVSFTIVFLFRLTLRRAPAAPALHVRRMDVLVPLWIYAGNMGFQVCLGSPVETRTIALFAMGIPLLVAVMGLARWEQPAAAAADVPLKEAA